MPRLFISYRTLDGADKATALARALGERYGDEQVFLDKDDLTGGVRWADEVARALQARPVLLLLLTPSLLAPDAQGRRPLDDPATPVRRELDAALAAGAVVLPLLADGVERLPPGLPPPLDALNERTWRRLRAYDWAADLARLQQDLDALGLPRAPARRARRTVAAALAVAAVGSIAAWALWPATPDAPADPLAGVWTLQVDGEPPLRLHVTRDAAVLRGVSEPVDIRQRADWAEYRAFWQERHGEPLDAVRLHAEGLLHEAPGSAPVLDLALVVRALPGGAPIDGGNLTLARQDGGDWAGQRWLNSAQADRPAVLRRSGDAAHP